jgi:hypothetical protein
VFSVPVWQKNCWPIYADLYQIPDSRPISHGGVS